MEQGLTARRRNTEDSASLHVHGLMSIDESDNQLRSQLDDPHTSHMQPRSCHRSLTEGSIREVFVNVGSNWEQVLAFSILF